MDILNLLEDFGTSHPQSSPPRDDEKAETSRLDAFEEGYKAGWDDAVQAHANDKNRLSAELAQNLMDMSFTYNEAHAQLTRSLRPLLSEIVDKLLPEAMHGTVGLRVVEELQKLADKSLNATTVITVAPENLDAIEAMLEHQHTNLATVQENASFADGQVQIAVANREIELNLSAVISEMSEMIESFYSDQNESRAYEREQAV